jgi:hypothetical protein
VIKRRRHAIGLGIDQDELAFFPFNSAVPEPVRFFDPVRLHVGQMNYLRNVAEKKFLRPLIIFEPPLRHGGQR